VLLISPKFWPVDVRESKTAPARPAWGRSRSAIHRTPFGEALQCVGYRLRGERQAILNFARRKHIDHEFRQIGFLAGSALHQGYHRNSDRSDPPGFVADPLSLSVA